MPIFLARSSDAKRSGSLEMGSPSMSTFPALGLSSPAMRERRVVLPATTHTFEYNTLTLHVYLG